MRRTKTIALCQCAAEVLALGYQGASDGRREEKVCVTSDWGAQRRGWFIYLNSPSFLLLLKRAEPS